LKNLDELSRPNLNGSTTLLSIIGKYYRLDPIATLFKAVGEGRL
jgi:hypothetical protein